MKYKEMQQLFHLYQIYQQILFEIEFRSPIYQQTVIFKYSYRNQYFLINLVVTKSEGVQK